MSESSTDVLYSSITKSITEIPCLQNPVEFLNDIRKKEEVFCDIQNDIKLLYNDCQKDNLCPLYKEVAKDMICHITDGRFEEFYRGKPAFLDNVETDVNETIKHVHRARKEMEDMLQKPSTDLISSEEVFRNLQAGKSKIIGSDILNECSDSLKKFKSNFQQITSMQKLPNSIKRDLSFEDSLGKFIFNAKMFQQVLESKKTLSEQKYEAEPRHFVTPPLHTEIISELLKDVERIKYTEP